MLKILPFQKLTDKEYQAVNIADTAFDVATDNYDEFNSRIDALKICHRLRDDGIIDDTSCTSASTAIFIHEQYKT